MFTGIVEETGTVRATSLSRGTPGVLVVACSRVLEGTSVGDSIAVSGVCQTVVTIEDGAFAVDVMPETVRSTTLGTLRAGGVVNLERALRLGDRLGGHIVNGHVDSVGVVRERRRESNAVVFEIALGGGLTRYVANKGSVAVDGVSLTVVSCRPDAFSVSVIPHTLDNTTLKDAVPGTGVNVEVDVLAKYVEALAAAGALQAGPHGADGGRAGEAAGGTGRPGGFEDSLLRGGFINPGEA